MLRHRWRHGLYRDPLYFAERIRGRIHGSRHIPDSARSLRIMSLMTNHCWVSGYLHVEVLYCFNLSSDLVANTVLTHSGRVAHVCVSKLTTIGSDNDLSPGGRKAIIQTSAGILLIWHLRTNFSDIVIKIYTLSLKKTVLKYVVCEMTVIFSRPQCVNVLLSPKSDLS